MFKSSLFHASLAVGVAALAMTSTVGRAQPDIGRRVIVERTVTPLQRGVIPGESHAPGHAQRRRQAAIRPASSPLDRIGTSGAAYVPGKVIVKFKDSASTSARAAAMVAMSRARPAAQAALAPARPAHANFDIVQIADTEDAEAVAAAIRESADVEYAQAAYRVRTRFVPNDKFYSRQWNLRLIDLERAWDLQPAAGSEMTVAVIDTGIAYTDATISVRAAAFTNADGVVYPALGDLSLHFVAATELGPSSRFVEPRDFIWNDSTPLDMQGHGTHVSGTIGQLTNNALTGTGDTSNQGGTAGVAFNVKLMPVKVIDGAWDVIFGSPRVGTDDVVAQGIRYAADRGANVINMSIGRSGPPAPVVEDAIRYAVSQGVFVAIAGGNGFDEGNETQVLAEIASRVAGAVSVAAVDRNKRHAPYSTTGPYIELSAPGGAFDAGPEGGVLQQTLDLDLVERFLRPPSQYSAPRFDALAYYYFTGTSMATPHVSGLAAMLMQQGITGPAVVEAALEHFSIDLGTPGRDATFGYGLIDARATLRGLGLAR
jgi:serine protease